MHVAAGAEVLSSAGYDDRLDVVGMGHGSKQIAQLGVGIERQRVLSFGSVERERGYFIRGFVLEMASLIGGE